MVERCLESMKLNDLCLTSGGNYELLEHLRRSLGEVVERLSARFGLIDGMGRPRKAFIIDALLQFGCVSCIRKVFMQQRKQLIDNLYLEMHSLAVNMLAGVLTQILSDLNLAVLCEEKGKYGRVDAAIKPSAFGVVVEAGNVLVIVEVKTGRSVGFAQLLRYLLEHPKAVLLVWRVRMRQVFAVKGEKLLSLLCLCAATAISRALSLLHSSNVDCQHNPSDRFGAVENPQELIDDFFDGLAESLPRAVSAVVKALKEG